MFKFFDRYILREIAPPFGIGLLLCTFVLLMNQILVLSELFITKGVSLGLAAEVLIYLIPSLLAFAVPMAVLMGILAGLSRLSTDSEITAFRTLGISSRRLARPVFVFALAGWLVTSYLTLFLAPRANYKWVQTITGSVLAKVQVRIIPREFNETIPKMVIYIQEIDRDRTWQNVFVYLTKDPAEPRLILAREGRLNLFPETKKATLDPHGRHGPFLSPGRSRRNTASPRSSGSRRGSTSKASSRRWPAGNGSGKRTSWSSEKACGSSRRSWPSRLPVRKQLAKEDAAPGAAVPDPAARLRERTRDLRAHWVEIHKKFALPFVCFIFVLLGLPLGMTTRKGGRTSGFTISIAVILFYYILITAGEKLAMDGRIPPFLGMWGPNILLFAAGALSFREIPEGDRPLFGAGRVPAEARVGRRSELTGRAAAGPACRGSRSGSPTSSTATSSGSTCPSSPSSSSASSRSRSSSPSSSGSTTSTRTTSPCRCSSSTSGPESPSSRSSSCPSPP